MLNWKQYLECHSLAGPFCLLSVVSLVRIRIMVKIWTLTLRGLLSYILSYLRFISPRSNELSKECGHKHNIRVPSVFKFFKNSFAREGEVDVTEWKHAKILHVRWLFQQTTSITSHYDYNSISEITNHQQSKKIIFSKTNLIIKNSNINQFIHSQRRYG